MFGKYAEHRDAYKSNYESIDHAGMSHRANIRVQSIQVSLSKPKALNACSPFNGILVPGGFGERGVEGKVDTIRYARERNIPFFGICLGMQCAEIEYGRNVLGLTGAHSTESVKKLLTR